MVSIIFSPDNRALACGVSHYVVAAQALKAADRFETRIDALVAQIGTLRQQVAEQQSAQDSVLDTLAGIERLRREEAARDREALQRLLTCAEEQRSACLKELEASLARPLAAPTNEVVALVSGVLGRHVTSTTCTGRSWPLAM